MVAKRLKYHDSSWVKGSLAVTIAAADDSGTLPSDFWGLIGQPNISGKTYTLKPLPTRTTKLIYTSDSIPIWYEVIGATLNVIPGSTDGCTINGYYWAKPTKITAPDDTMPYQELFDDTIQEALLYAHAGGMTDANYIGIMENFINKSIDEIIPGLEQVKPTKIPNATNYNDLMWS